MGFTTTFLMAWIIMVSKLASCEQPPNIILIIADDLGWEGVSFHGSLIQTPNIDALAYDGIILNNYYVQPICTPSRATLLTGRYPIHTGMHLPLSGLKPDAIRLNEKLLPEYLREMDYKTHLLGKWHVGFHAEPYLPTSRGFDSHFGYLDGHNDYFGHFHWAWEKYPDSLYLGYDWRDNLDVDTSVIGKYSTELLSSRAEQIITNHDKTKPLFLQFAHQAVHFANGNALLQAPASYINRFQHITNEKQRLFAAMHAALDDSVANVTEALIQAGMINNTVIVFTSDNGGLTEMSPNWPLRGGKGTLWEGGTRVPAFIWSPLLEKSHYVSNHLMHISDWLPTFLHIAGYDTNSLPLNHLDGFDMWDVLSSNLDASLRNEVLYDIDPFKNASALRVDNMKIILGSEVADWYYPPQNAQQNTSDESSNEQKPDPIVSNIPVLISEALGGEFHGGTPIVVDCGERPPNALTNCDPTLAPCLFDLDKDPCEFNNLASLLPEKVRELLDRMEEYKATSVQPVNNPVDLNGLPIYHCGVWSPWDDEDDEDNETRIN